MMTELALAARVFSLLCALSPPSLAETEETYPEARELAEGREERYQEVADDVARAVSYLHPSDRGGAAELLVAIAWHESKLRRDVDLGPCAPARVAWGYCDHGLAVGLWQLHRISWELPRAEQARKAIRGALGSQRACRHRDPPERLALYASGKSCDDPRGVAASREIWRDLQAVRALRVVKEKE